MTCGKFARLLFVCIITSSCSSESEGPAIQVPTGPAVQAQLLEFFENGLWYDFVDHSENFHQSVFVVLSPSALCGSKLVIAHRELPTEIGDWPNIGTIFRLRVTEQHATYLEAPPIEASSSSFIYTKIPIVGVIGGGRADEECF